MDFSAIIGVISGLGLIVYGILTTGGVLKSFWDIGSVIITLGGVAAASFISFPISDFKEIAGHMKVLLRKKMFDPKVYIEKIVDYAQDARKKGLLALEDKASQEESKDEFFKNCVMMIVDTIDPEKTKEMMENELNCLESRHAKGYMMYEKMATYAPAFGMIGTLIGLVNMLASLDTSSADAAANLGKGMSAALITTFYGSLIANLILMPFASKLRMRHAEEMRCKEMIVEGVLAIQAGNNPRTIEERLLAYLNTKEKSKVNSVAGGGGEDGGGGGGKKPKKGKK